MAVARAGLVAGLANFGSALPGRCMGRRQCAGEDECQPDMLVGHGSVHGLNGYFTRVLGGSVGSCLGPGAFNAYGAFGAPLCAQRGYYHLIALPLGSAL